MIQLIGMGISRTTAEALMQFLPANEMSRENMEGWIRKRSWEGMNLSVFFKNELRRYLGE
jgi:hypothetical protein